MLAVVTPIPNLHFARIRIAAIVMIVAQKRRLPPKKHPNPRQLPNLRLPKLLKEKRRPLVVLEREILQVAVAQTALIVTVAMIHLIAEEVVVSDVLVECAQKSAKKQELAFAI